jgi:hypothetical protein
MNKIVHVHELTEKHLGKKVSLAIPYDTIEGELTDFYGSLDDESSSIIVIEIDEQQYILDNSYTVEILS